MTEDEPTMTLAEYRRQAEDNANAFWYLSAGDHQNLLQEALDLIEELEEKLAGIDS